MKLKIAIRLVGMLGLLVVGPVCAQTWQAELAKMPLAYSVSELNEKNCADVMLPSLRWNPVVKALVFMPGATDEFYFFHRAKAVLTNGSPTLLDAVSALTNQTLIVVTFRAPFLILHTAEDPMEPVGIIEDKKTAERIRHKEFKHFAIYNDRRWDEMQPMLQFELNTRVLPPTKSHDTAHFFRNTFCCWELNGWQMLEAMAMAGKTKFTVKKKVVVFEGDTRFLTRPPTPEGFLLKKAK
ncbi:MAG: hypothetical protein ACXWJB_12640 [Limisphaerales bacterium]